MTKAELIKALEDVPDYTPLYAVDFWSNASIFDVTIVNDIDGEVAEIHFNH